MKDKLLSSAAFVTAVALVVVFASPNYRQGEASLAGKPAPDFAFTLNGKPARLSDLRGKIVVLNVWATWCPPCVEEMPALNRLHAQIEPLGGLVLGLNVDESLEAYEQFLRDHAIRFPNHRDASKAIAVEYGTSMYPETYIIGRDGRFLRKVIGPQDWQSPEWTQYFAERAR